MQVVDLSIKSDRGSAESRVPENNNENPVVLAWIVSAATAVARIVAAAATTSRIVAAATVLPGIVAATAATPRIIAATAAATLPGIVAATARVAWVGPAACAALDRRTGLSLRGTPYARCQTNQSDEYC